MRFTVIMKRLLSDIFLGKQIRHRRLKKAETVNISIFMEAEMLGSLPINMMIFLLKKKMRKPGV